MTIKKLTICVLLAFAFVVVWVMAASLFVSAQANPISLAPTDVKEVSQSVDYLSLPKLDPFWDELFVNGGNLNVVLPTDVVKRNWSNEYMTFNAIDRRL